MARKTESGADAADVEDVISSCGQCQMTPSETALIAGIDVAEIENGKYTDVYLREKLKAELNVRRTLLQKALDGDGAAQREYLALAEANYIDLDENQT